MAKHVQLVDQGSENENAEGAIDGAGFDDGAESGAESDADGDDDEYDSDGDDDDGDDEEKPAAQLATVTPKVVSVDDKTVPGAGWRQKALDLKAQSEDMSFQIAEVLHEIYSKGFYKAWGFPGWQDYIDRELSFSLRKAQYLIGLQEWFGKMKPEVVAWIRSLGWSAAKELIGIVTNENAAEWKRTLEGKSVKGIQQALKDAAGGEGGEGGGGGEGSGNGGEEKPTSMGFKLFKDQRDNVELALKKAGQQAGSDKTGHQLDLVCTNYLATSVTDTDMASTLASYERIFGIELIAFNRHLGTEGEIVYGQALVNELSPSPEDDPAA